MMSFVSPLSSAFRGVLRTSAAAILTFATAALGVSAFCTPAVAQPRPFPVPNVRPFPVRLILAEPIFTAGTFQWTQGPGATLASGPTVASLRGTRLFLEGPGGDASAGLQVNIGMAADLVSSDPNGFSPESLILQPELAAGSPLSSLQGTLFAWTPEARSGGGWTPRSLPSRAGGVISGSMIALAAPLTLSAGASGPIVDVAWALRSAGGFPSGTDLAIFFEDPRFPESNPRRFKRILKGAPTATAFVRDIDAALEKDSAAYSVDFGGEVGPTTVLENSVYAGRTSGWQRITRTFDTRSAGRVEVQIDLRDIPDATGSFGFGHSVVEGFSIVAPGADGKTVEVFAIKKQPLAMPESPVKVGSIAASGALTSVPLADFEDPNPRDWLATEYQYYRVIGLKIDGESFVVLSLRQGTENPLDPSRGFTFPF